MLQHLMNICHGFMYRWSGGRKSGAALVDWMIVSCGGSGYSRKKQESYSSCYHWDTYLCQLCNYLLKDFKKTAGLCISCEEMENLCNSFETFWRLLHECSLKFSCQQSWPSEILLGVGWRKESSTKKFIYWSKFVPAPHLWSWTVNHERKHDPGFKRLKEASYVEWLGSALEMKLVVHQLEGAQSRSGIWMPPGHLPLEVFQACWLGGDLELPGGIMHPFWPWNIWRSPRGSWRVLLGGGVGFTPGTVISMIKPVYSSGRNKII